MTLHELLVQATTLFGGMLLAAIITFSLVVVQMVLIFRR